MAEFATVSYSTEGPVARIAINRPDTVSYTHLTLPTILLV